MRTFAKIFVLLCLTAPLWGQTTRYVAQTAGTVTGGTACNGQTAITLATWNVTAESPGDITWVCGNLTVSTGTNGLVPAWSGSSGSTITINYDTGASITSPAMGAGIYINSLSYITINGGPSCGYISGTDVSCNGKIYNTSNGSSGATCPGGTCTTQAQSYGIQIVGDSSHIIVQNMQLGPMYVRTNNTDETNGFGYPVQITGGTNNTVQNNYLNNGVNCLSLVYDSAGTTGFLAQNNQIANCDELIPIIDAGANATGSGVIQFNDVHDTYPWDSPDDVFHNDGYHGQQLSTGSKHSFILNGNYFHFTQTPSAHQTSWMYASANSSSTAIGDVFVNNIVVTSGSETNGGMYQGQYASGLQIIGNTISCGNNGLGIAEDTHATSLYLRNNIVTGCGAMVYYDNTATIASADYDLYNCTNGNLNGCFIAAGVFENFGGWKGGGFDTHGIGPTTNPLLNSNFTLTSSSPARSAGVNLTSSCGTTSQICTDAAGNSRPGSGSWDIGAYQFSAAVPTVSLSAASLYYSNQFINVISAAQSVTLTNTGSATLNITSITAGSPYVITGNTCGSTLGLSSSCTVTVTFNPTSAGYDLANLAFVTNASTSPNNVVLNGLAMPLPSQGNEVCAYSVPLNSAAGATLWTHFNAVINNPLFQCVTWTVPLGCTGSCGSAVYLDHVGTGIASGGCPSWTFTDLDTTLSVLPSSKTNNLILQGASFVNNSSTAQYIGSQNWADNLDTDCATQNSALTRATNHPYLPGDYILVGSTYWQNTTVCSNSDANDIHCTSGNGSPSFSPTTIGTQVTDGAVTWTSTGSHAPPQDYWCDSNTTGNAQYDCFKFQLSGSANINSSHVATVTLGNDQTYSVGQTGYVTGASNTNFNCGSTANPTAAHITDVSVHNQIQYTCTTQLTQTSSTTLSSGVFTASSGHYLNIQSTNATVAMLQTQLPVPWEMPMRIWRQAATVAINSHYAGFTNGFSAGTYIRNGLTKAGETDTSNSNGWPIWSGTAAGSNAQAQMLSYENDMFKFFKATGAGTNYTCVANLHTYGTPEAAYSAAQGCGFDNNALGVNQVTAIVEGNALTPGAIPNGGNWPIAFANYTNTPKILQTGGHTQQGSATCFPGEVGSMAADPTCTFSGTATTSGTTITITSGTASSTWCSQLASASPSLLLNGIPVQLATSGCSSGTLIAAATLPTYSSPVPWSFPYPFSIQGYPGNWPVAKAYGATVSETYLCDLLRATDPNYDSIGAPCTQNEALLPDAYQIPYSIWDANFAAYGYQTTGSGTGTFTWGNQCGPPTYLCANTTLTAVQNAPTPFTGTTGVGQFVTPLDFGNSMLRVTDVTTVPNKSCYTNTGGSPQTNQFNLDSTMIWYQCEGGYMWVNSLNTSVTPWTTSVLYAGSVSHIVGPCPWSYANKYWLYCLGGTNGTQIIKYDFTSGVPPTSSVVYDFANCGINFTVSWSTFGGPNKFGGGLIPSPDTIFGAAFSSGGQDTGVNVVSYNANAGGCSNFNTSTGAVTAYGWGVSGTIPVTDRFTIHDMQTFRGNSGYLVVSWENCTAGACSAYNNSNPYFWQSGTLTFTRECPMYPSGLCSGHAAVGSGKFVNVSNTPLWQQVIRDSMNPSDAANIPMGLPTSCSNGVVSGCNSQHSSWVMADVLDTVPFGFGSTGALANGTAAACGQGYPSSFTCSWVDEIALVNPTTGTVYRESHTFNSDANFNFACQNAIPTFSQDGKFAMITSDMNKGLGTEGTGNYCNVFITNLR